LGLKSALAVVNGAVTDATVEKSPTMAVYKEPPPTWPWVPLLVLVSLGQGEPRKGKTLWNSDFPARLSLARLGTGHHHPPPPKKNKKSGKKELPRLKLMVNRVPRIALFQLIQEVIGLSIDHCLC